VFHHHYYDAITRVKCSLSRSDGNSIRFLTSWWFIPHKPYSSIKWATDHQWHFPCKRRGITIMDCNTQGPPDCQELGPSLLLGSLFVPPSYPLQHQSKCAISFTVKRYVIRLAKCEARIQHDKRDEQRSVLNRHRWKTTSTPEPGLVVANYSVRSPIIYQHMVISSISSIP
jgi:hypothetical protein